MRLALALLLVLTSCRRETPVHVRANQQPISSQTAATETTPAQSHAALREAILEEIAPVTPADSGASNEGEKHAERRDKNQLKLLALADLSGEPTSAPVVRRASAARAATTVLRPLVTSARTVPMERALFGPDLFLGSGYWFLEFGPIIPTPELFRQRAIFVLRGCMIGERRVPTTLWGLSIFQASQSHGMLMVPVRRDTPRIPVWIYDALGTNGDTTHIVLDPASGYSTLLWCGIIEADGSVTTMGDCGR